jgi:patatin-like phospholipase/acyl hydrolase
MTTSNSKYLILACDGGGIRGLIPALLLQELATSFPTFIDSAYLLAGTSTGGIISLALACNLTPTNIVNLYSNDGSEIFKLSACIQSSGGNPQSTQPASSENVSDSGWLAYLLSHLADLLCVWYDNSGLKSAIQTTLGDAASSTLASLVPAPPAQPRYVLVNTFQLCDSTNIWHPLQLTNLPNITNGSGETLVIDAAMSTSAAPIYFPPYQHPTYGYCADGGLFANNPGTVALTTLVQSGVALENIWMLSLSTGNTLNCYADWIINGLGFGAAGSPLFWLWPKAQTGQNANGATYTPSMPLLNALFDATSEVDANQCQQLLGTRYQRAKVPLTQPIELNDYSQAAITAMNNSVTAYMKKTDWTNITSWIKTNFT